MSSTITGSTVEILSIKTLSSRHATITEITALIQGDLVRVHGTARRCPEDKNIPKVGNLLSVARAFESLARKAQRRADGLMAHYEDIVRQRPIQQAKRDKWRNDVMISQEHDPHIRQENLRRVRESEGSWTARKNKKRPTKIMSSSNGRGSL